MMNLQNYPTDKEQTEGRFRKELDFLAVVSHEIRNPLHAVIGLSRLLKMPSSEEERQKYTDSLIETSEHLLELVNNIMDFSRVEAGKVEFISKTTDLRRAIQQSLIGQKAIAESHGLDFHLEIDENLPPLLKIDSVKINEVILNLVSNAIKFTKQGSVAVNIKVEKLKSSEAEVSFAVSDTGMGIPKKEINSIFEAYNQGGEDINRRYGGTGLGLSISRKIIDALGGELKVKSEVGLGSIFSFTIDMEIDQPQLDFSMGEYLPARVFVDPLRVLVVDDNKINILIARKHLEQWGFIYEVAQSGAEAARIVQEQEFDVILMDLHMPGMDGLAATRVIRNLPEPRYKDLPIIGLTASTESSQMEKIYSAGFTDVLNKPYLPETLLNKITATAEPKLV